MSNPARTVFCSHCAHDVPVSYWASDVDPGDRGYVRSCGHGDYVTTISRNHLAAVTA